MITHVDRKEIRTPTLVGVLRECISSGENSYLEGPKLELHKKKVSVRGALWVKMTRPLSEVREDKKENKVVDREGVSFRGTQFQL